MRHIASLLPFSIVSAVASVAAAQATGPAKLTSNTNYVFASNATCCNNSCTNLQDLTVSLVVTEDIVAASSTCGGTAGDIGFSIQLNANSPNSITGNFESAFQQYVVEVGQSDAPNASGLDNITGKTQLWANTIKDGNSPIPQLVPLSTPIPNVTLPAGYTLTWKLFPDSSGKVTSVTYQVTDASGNVNRYNQPIASQYQAPIAAFELDFVGWPGCGTTFQSGAGTITYKSTSTSFSPQSAVPTCVGGNRGPLATTETSTDTVYGSVPKGPSESFTQKFSLSSWVGNFHGQNARLNNDYDWMFGYWKGECGGNTPVMAGVSNQLTPTVFSEDWWTQAILCATSDVKVSKSVNDYVLVLNNADDRRDTSTGDWAPGYFKAECGATDAMVGIAQTTNYDGSTIVGARCMGTENVLGQFSCENACNVEANALLSPRFDGDWSYGYYKAQCGQGSYVKGVANNPNSGGQGSEQCILCCTPFVSN